MFGLAATMVPYLLVAADVPDISHVGGLDTDKGHDAAVCIDDDVLTLASLAQSLPNPRGGSTACRSPMSKSQMACKRFGCGALLQTIR